jgi:hypothetical protein
MKKFNIPFMFGSVKRLITVYIGSPEREHHPLQHQLHWLQKERGASPVAEIMDSLTELHKIAKANGVPFEELCAYALKEAVSSHKVTEKKTEDQQTANN